MWNDFAEKIPLLAGWHFVLPGLFLLQLVFRYVIVISLCSKDISKVFVLCVLIIFLLHNTVH